MTSYLRNPDTGELYTSDELTIEHIMDGIDTDLLVKSSEYRREVTRFHPLRWMLIYVPHLMQSDETNNELNINDLNIILCHHGLEFAAPKTKPKRNGLRKCFLCPRGAGKTSTTQAVLLWAMCHRHLRYIYIFSGSDNQAESHLADIKHEIFTNKLIEADYKGLTEPARLVAKKVAEADNKNIYRSQSGITIEARSIWSSVVGAKRDGKRPDCLILDDCSRGEGASSTNISSKQLDVLLGTILPLNINAPTWAIGTVHFNGSVEDELLRSTMGEKFEWVEDEKFEVHWVKPIVATSDGSLRSIWSKRWTLDFLLSESHTRTYSKDFLNRPMAKFLGVGWDQSDFIIPSALPQCSRIILAVDPGVSAKGDPTGLAVLGISLVTKQVVAYEVIAVRLKSVALKAKILELCNTYGVQELVWESNQGGEALAESTLGADFPLLVHLEHANKNKLVRAEVLLGRYKKKQILHRGPFPSYESECKAFPAFIASPNQLDAVGMGVEFLATSGAGTRQLSTIVRGGRR